MSTCHKILSETTIFITSMHISAVIHQHHLIKHHMVKFTCNKSLGDIQIWDAGGQGTESQTTKDADRAHHSYDLTTPLLHGPTDKYT